MFSDRAKKRQVALDKRPVRDASCDLCGQKDFETVAQRDRKGRELHTVVCRNCGLVSHARIPTEEELAAYYQRQYRHEYNRHNAQFNEHGQKQAKILTKNKFIPVNRLRDQGIYSFFADFLMNQTSTYKSSYKHSE